MLLWQMTASKDPAFLAKLRSEALDSLIEIASWTWNGHAMPARFILGRLAGMPEEQIGPLAMAHGTPTELITAARKR